MKNNAIWIMNIFFDHQTFSLQSYGGISRYYVELIRELNKYETVKTHLSLLFSDNVYLETLAIKPYKLPELIRQPLRSSIQYRINKLYCKQDIKKTQFDVFHSTYYDSYFVEHISKKPLVVTFLDMIHERYADEFVDLAADKKITNRKKKIANEATCIIAISESTKRDLIELMGIPEEKIKVIYLGSSINYNSTNNSELNSDLTKPFLLYVGNRNGYKNFDWFLEAIAPLVCKFDLNIICAGGGHFLVKEKKLIETLKLVDKVIQMPIDDVLLEQLYRNAVAFIFPSLYEGFGLPVLEAFACNCPCIVSKVSSLPEVAGDAALYIDTGRAESLHYAVEQILCDSVIRRDLIIKGQQQLSRFSWQHTASQTLELYNSIV